MLRFEKDYLDFRFAMKNKRIVNALEGLDVAEQFEKMMEICLNFQEPLSMIPTIL